MPAWNPGPDPYPDGEVKRITDFEYFDELKLVYHAEVHVEKPPESRWQLSADGGVQPRWGAGGRELYYLDSNGQVMMVAMPDGDPTKARSPRPLFGLRLEPSTAFDQFAPVLDGQSFLVRRARRPGGADTGPVHVVVNWPETLPTPTDVR